VTFKEELEADISSIIDTELKVAYGTVVPHTSSFNLGNAGIRLEAAYMYCDLIGSTKLATEMEDTVVAKTIKAFLATVSRVVLHYDGEIRSFDGDRVMGIFIGDDKCDRAVRTAWTIHWAVKELAHHALWIMEDAIFHSNWTMRAGIGIDTGYALIVRGGVRNHNDLVSIGGPPNIAAKLSEIRSPDHPTRTWITDEVFDELSHPLKYGEKPDGEVILKWSNVRWTDVGGRWANVRSSTYWLSHK